MDGDFTLSLQVNTPAAPADSAVEAAASQMVTHKRAASFHLKCEKSPNACCNWPCRANTVDCLHSCPLSCSLKSEQSGCIMENNHYSRLHNEQRTVTTKAESRMSRHTSHASDSLPLSLSLPSCFFIALRLHRQQLAGDDAKRRKRERGREREERSIE